MDDTISQFGVLSLFHIAGGLIVGWNARQGLAKGWSCKLLSGMFWGAVYGLVPLLVEIFILAEAKIPYLPLLGLVIFVAAIFGALLIPDVMLETFSIETFGPILFGGALMVLGVYQFFMLVRESLPQALIGFVVTSGFGGFALVKGVLKALRG